MTPRDRPDDEVVELDLPRAPTRTEADRERLPAAAEEPATVGAVVGATMSPPLALLLAIPASLLPRPWRARLRLDTTPLGIGCIITAAVEAGAALLAIPSLHGLHAVLASLAGVVCALFFLEGLIRGAAVAFGERLPTLPLWLVEQGRAGLTALVRRGSQGPLVVDQVVRGPGHWPVRIETCRERGWNETTVLRFESRAYRVTGHDQHPGAARRHRYHLEPVASASQSVEYHPSDVLAQ